MLQAWLTAAAYEHASVGEAGPFRYVGVGFAAFLDWLLVGGRCRTCTRRWVCVHHRRGDLGPHPRGQKIGRRLISCASQRG